MNKKTNGISSALYTLGIVTLFLGGFLLLTVFGAVSYRNIAAVQEQNNHKREILSYLHTAIISRQNNPIYINKVSDADSEVLVIEDTFEDYGIRIYVYQGNLMEEYGLLDEQLVPEDGSVLGENSRLEFSLIGKDLLRIVTDEGEVYVRVNDFRGEQ